MALTKKQIENLAAHLGRTKKKLNSQYKPIEPPLAVEAQYTVDIRRLPKQVTALVKKGVLPLLEKFEAFYADIGIVQDEDLEVELKRAFRKVGKTLTKQKRNLDRYAVDIATKAVGATNTFNRAQWVGQINKLAGIDIREIAQSPGVNKELLTRVSKNVNLIKTVQPQYLKEIEQAVTQGLSRGDNFFSIKDRLKEIETTNTRYRPKLIARDQVSKLNGNLNQIRQEDLGIKKYIWRTVGDGNVRQSHQDNDGKTFAWDKPPETGHPGEDINCRCVAEPIFDDFLEDVEREGANWKPTEEQQTLKKFPKAKRTKGTKARTRPRRAAGAPKSIVRDLPDIREAVHLPRSGKEIKFSPAQQERDQLAGFVRSTPERMEVLTDKERRDVLHWNWIHGAKRKMSVGMKEAAKAEFGGRGIVYNPRGFTFSAEQIKGIQKDVRVMYNETQKALKAKGIKSVKVFRGLKSNVIHPGSVESWTTDIDIARKFGPIIITDEVPASKILNYRGNPSWVDGIFGNQKEVVVMR